MENDSEASKFRRDLIEYVILIGGLFLTYLISLYNYLLFHSIAEVISIVISGGIFLIGWHSRKYMDSSFFLILGVSFLFISVLDLIHTLAYFGMGIFLEFNANLPTQLWIVARYWQSLSYLFASIIIKKKIKVSYLFVSNIIIIIILLTTIFQGFFPTCWIDGSGLTPFKIISEYVIDIILLVTLIVLYKHKDEFDPKILLLIVISIIATIISELVFTFYINVVGFPNFIGHIFKIIAFFFVYKAIIQLGIETPFDLLFRKLKLSEETSIEKANQLEQAYSEFNQMFNASLPLRVISKDCEIMRVNETYASLFRVPKEDLIGKKCYDFHLGYEHRCNTELCSKNQILEGKNYYEYELDTKFDDGTKIVSLVRTVPYKNAKGDFIGIIQNFTNITERKIAQEKIEDMARFPLENPIPVLRVSTKYIIYANKVSQKLFSIEEGSKIPKDLQEHVNKSFSEDLNLEIELNIIDQIYTLFIVPIKDRGYANIYGMNITARKEAEESLERFVSTLSHELRTPISVLIMSLDLLDNHREKVALDVQKKLQEGIKRNIYLLKDLVDDILMLSRIDERKIKLKWEEYNPLLIINNILTLMEPIGNAKNITFSTDIDQEIKLYGDPIKIDQIFRIFIDNAIKFSKESNKIEISAINHYKGKYNTDEKDGVLFQIKDYGIGILVEELPSIFLRFFRSEQVSDIPGSGLGLSIAKELLKLHDGEVWAQSDYGTGSTFFIFLPINKKKNIN
ncbi:MAG: ATP-binding protein [Candidatus Lokiarchaeota archaeon]|nr:ATP-binding protein [Candidatus Lokiarchaeota archaeon]